MRRTEQAHQPELAYDIDTVDLDALGRFQSGDLVYLERLGGLESYEARVLERAGIGYSATYLTRLYSIVLRRSGQILVVSDSQLVPRNPVPRNPVPRNPDASH